MEKGLDFQTLREARGITLDAIAKEAEVPMTSVFLFEIGIVIDEQVQLDIIHALSVLKWHYYKATDIKQYKPKRERVGT